MGPKKTTRPKKVKAQVSRPRSSMQTARASGSSRSGNQISAFRAFNTIKKVGWINEPLDVGYLISKYKQKGSVVFKFQNGRKDFTAWSVSGPNAKNDWGNTNFSMLEEGYSYVLQGQILVKTKSKTYNRSISTSSKYSLRLSKIHVVQKSSQPNLDLLVSRQTVTLKKINEMVKDDKYFTEEIQNVKICYAKFHRYMGCEQCSKAIHYPDKKDGKYYCQICMKKSGPKKRKVCLVLRNMILKDSEGTCQGGFVCFSNGYGKLMKAEEVSKICTSPSDILARKKSESLVGLVVNVRIKHQKAARGRNGSSLIAEVLSVNNDTQTSAEDSDDNFSENGDRHEGEGAMQMQPSSSTTCGCECEEIVVDDVDEEDEDNDINVIPHKRMRHSSGGSTSGMIDDGNALACIDTDGQYPLTSKPVGCVLIVNMNFSKTTKERRGAPKDVEALKEFFELNLKMSVRVEQDVSSKNLQSIIKDFKKTLIKNDSSCCFVIFMSHGILYNVTMADGMRMNVFTDIMDQFSEKNFKQFCGKPKIFIFQACSYFNATDLVDCAGFERNPTDIHSDMLYITASLPGIKATRHKVRGSYFIQTFVNVLKCYAKTKDLEKILKLTQEEMREVGFGEGKLKRNIPMYCPILFRNFKFS